MSPRRLRLTRANVLTLVRVLLAPAIALAILKGSAVVATAIFWAAVVTDMTDGRVARRRGEASENGRLLDHSADAFFVSSGIAALAFVGSMPALLAPLIVLAFVQYAVDARCSGAREPRASRLGHWNGIAYYVAVATPIIRDSLDFSWPGATFVAALGWLLVASTLLSMANRLRALRSAE